MFLSRANASDPRSGALVKSTSGVMCVGRCWPGIRSQHSVASPASSAPSSSSAFQLSAKMKSTRKKESKIFPHLSTKMCPSLSLSGKHGVGRIDIVENRSIGMKSRGKQLKIIFIFTGLGCDVLFSLLVWQAPSLKIHFKCSETETFALWEHVSVF